MDPAARHKTLDDAVAVVGVVGTGLGSTVPPGWRPTVH